MAEEKKQDSKADEETKDNKETKEDNRGEWGTNMGGSSADY